MKKAILIFVSLGFIVGGLYFSTTNLYQLSKGYLMYKFSDPEDFVKKSKIVKAEKIKNPVNQPLYKKRPVKGEQMGILTIPKLDAALPIYHGTDEDELEKGVGHFADSVLPGEKDNSVLSGHRDTVFRRLGEVSKGDLLIVETSAGKFTYKVGKVRIVDKDDRTVIVPAPRPTLTVSTCYPFRFVGSAPERYILVAYLIKKDLNN